LGCSLFGGRPFFIALGASDWVLCLNRQINVRLQALISFYTVLGGTFSGAPAVGTRQLRDPEGEGPPTLDRARRLRDAVEGALSAIIPPGTEDQARLAAAAAMQAPCCRVAAARGPTGRHPSPEHAFRHQGACIAALAWVIPD